LSSSRSRVDASSVMTVAENSKYVPDTCSASPPALTCDEALRRLGVSSPASAEPVDRQSAVCEDVLSLESQSVTASDCFSAKSSTANEDSSVADAGEKEDTTGKDDCGVSCRQGSSSAACQVPVMSLSCSSLASRLGGYVPSPGPLTQMYGGGDVVQAASSQSPASSSSSTSSSVRNSSLLTYSPLKVGGDVSEITAKISAARLCSRNGTVVAAESDACARRWTGLRAADSRSTSWLATVDRVRWPSALAHSCSVSGSLAGNCSSSSSVNSCLSKTPLASRSSSLVSTDSSTLRSSTLVPADNSRKLIHFTIARIC